MSFWTRHAALLVLTVLTPFGVALYIDTTSVVEQAQKRSRDYVQQAVPRLLRMVEKDAYDSLTEVMATAHEAVIGNKVADLGRSGSRGERALTGLLKLLEAAKPKRGFAWLVDRRGRVLLSAGRSNIDENPPSIDGHPIFVSTQLGYALDGLWSARPEFVVAVGAPLVDDDGDILGAIVLGRPIDKEAVTAWGGSLGGHVTLSSDKRVLVSSAPDALAKTVVEASKKEVVNFSGQSEEPLTDDTIPLLPLFVDHRATGHALVSYSTHVEGAPPQFSWVVSVDATAGLDEIAERQSGVLGAMVAAFLVALLVGILNFRGFVVPIHKIAEHLSDLNMGKGDLQMPENEVSRPFRRIVKLVNMTVLKIPNRALVPTADIGSMSTRPPGMVGPEEELSLGDLGPLGTNPPGAPGGPSGISSLRSPPQPISPPPASPPPAPPLAAPPPPPPSAGDDKGPDLVLGADGLDSLSFESLPPSPVPPSVPTPVVNTTPARSQFELSEQTEALAPPADTHPSDMAALGVPSTPGAEEAIAEAIAQLEGGPADASAGSRRSAADIRGRPMAGSLEAAGPVEEVSIPPSGPVAPRPGVRGGGSLDLRQPAALPHVNEEERAAFGPEETVVAPVASELLAQSAREDLTGRHTFSQDDKPDATVVATVPADLLAQSAARDPTSRAAAPPSATLDPEDHEHFKEVYERFIDLRRRCGEPTNDLAFERFLAKLVKNRDSLMKKYNCRTVRFQVYKKDGKAALKATPVGARP